MVLSCSDSLHLNDIEIKTEAFTSKVTRALDECAPFKTFKPRQNYRPGITDKAKKLIMERDKTRQSISKANKAGDKKTLQYPHQGINL